MHCIIPLTPVDCHSTGENQEVDKNMKRERTNLCLKTCSGLLSPSSPKPSVQDSNVTVRDALERSPSFEGNIHGFTIAVLL